MLIGLLFAVLVGLEAAHDPCRIETSIGRPLMLHYEHCRDVRDRASLADAGRLTP